MTQMLGSSVGWLSHKEVIRSRRQKAKSMHTMQEKMKTRVKRQFQINITKEKHLIMKLRHG